MFKFGISVFTLATGDGACWRFKNHHSQPPAITKTTSTINNQKSPLCWVWIGSFLRSRNLISSAMCVGGFWGATGLLNEKNLLTKDFFVAAMMDVRWTSGNVSFGS